MDKMIALAWHAYPAEVVGLVGSTRHGRVKSIYGLRNLAPHRAFFADPCDQYLAIRKIRRAGDRLIATFHSHPEGPAKLSEEDRKYVFEVAPMAIVIALDGRARAAHVAAFMGCAAGIENVVEISVR
jgi:[CysO sulfur-carrier protein]-S-L-cysteine hydrolase